jgi:hypothetical protein
VVEGGLLLPVPVVLLDRPALVRDSDELFLADRVREVRQVELPHAVLPERALADQPEAIASMVSMNRLGPKDEELRGDRPFRAISPRDPPPSRIRRAVRDLLERLGDWWFGGGLGASLPLPAR